MLSGIVLSEGWLTGARFVGAARRYWIGVFPPVCAELRSWRRRAAAIPDPALRRVALEAGAKRENMEGAAVFAAYAPRSARPAAIRAAVAFQSAYNYLDLLSEQPCADPVANGRALHQALSHAVRPGARSHGDYYAHARSNDDDDDGYLHALVDACRGALATLPSAETVAAAIRSAAERVIEFQTFNLGEAACEHRLLARWAQSATPAGSDLRWWETAAAAGSSLGVHVLIAAASDPDLGAEQVRSLEQAYFPWVGALHSLLDTVVDLAEDARTGQRSLISYYSDAQEAASRMRWLVERSRAATGELPDRARHVMFLAAMTGMYLSVPEARDRRIRVVREEVLDAVGRLAAPTLLVFALRRCLGAVMSAARRRGRGGFGRPDSGRRRDVWAMGCSAELEEPFGAVMPLQEDRAARPCGQGPAAAASTPERLGEAAGHQPAARPRISTGVGGATAG